MVLLLGLKEVTTTSGTAFSKCCLIFENIINIVKNLLSQFMLIDCHSVKHQDQYHRIRHQEQRLL